MALRHNSKSLRDELNSSRSGLIIRATFTPSERTCERSVSNEDPQADVARRGAFVGGTACPVCSGEFGPLASELLPRLLFIPYAAL